MKAHFMLLIIIILISSLLLANDFGRPAGASPEEIRESIGRAIGFLHDNQLDYGEFRTFACTDEQMTECHQDSSPFITSFVLYSIRDIDDERVGEMANRSLDFLLSEQEEGGVWRFWSFRSPERIDADFDDISVVSAALLMFNISFEDNIGLFRDYRNEEGSVYTWLSETQENEIDCEVNANILFYFGIRGIDDQKICDFINDKIRSDEYSCCIYCEDRIYGKNYLSLFYMVSRALVHGNPCLKESGDKIIEKTLAIQNLDGSFGNDLDTAFALNTLLNLNYNGNEIEVGISELLKIQKKNGSWEREIFFLGPAPYYGSEELTTALAVEALNKYLMMNS